MLNDATTMKMRHSVHRHSAQHYAESRNSVHYAECHYFECRFDERSSDGHKINRQMGPYSQHFIFFETYEWAQ
jgi:hypothetical protein